MKIRMLTSLAGDNFSYQPNDVINQPDKVAKEWVKKGMAELFVPEGDDKSVTVQLKADLQAAKKEIAELRSAVATQEKVIDEYEQAIALTPSDYKEDLSDKQKLKKVIEAITKLDKKEQTHFTKSGLPDATALTEKCGFQVSSDLRDDAWKAVKKGK